MVRSPLSSHPVLIHLIRPFLALLLFPIALLAFMFYFYHRNNIEQSQSINLTFDQHLLYHISNHNHTINQSNDLPIKKHDRLSTFCSNPLKSSISNQSVEPSTLSWGKYHAKFTNVCFREGRYDEKLREYIPGRTLMFGVSLNKQIEYGAYFSKQAPDWGLKNEYVNDTVFPPLNPINNQPIKLLKGRTFFYTLFNDNIAQFYQELMCHIPAMMNREYRLSINDTVDGVTPQSWNHFFAPHMRMEYGDNPSVNTRWCPAQVRWLVNALQETQPNTRIAIFDEGLKDVVLRTYKEDRSIPIACFDSVTIYQSGACNGLSGPYPPGTSDTYAIMKRSLLNQLKLEKTRPCASQVMIYDRYDALRRRMMNAAEMKSFLEEKLRISNKPNVTINHIQSIPKNVFVQAPMFNKYDIVIQPHSASNYNALFMHDNSLHIEIGQHGTWFGQGVAPYIKTGLEYKTYNSGVKLIPWNKTFDNQEFPGERSFYITKELMETIWNDMQHRFCNQTSP